MRSRKSKSGDRIIADPIKEPVEFLRAPLGRPVSNAVEVYIAEASDCIAMAMTICERYGWILSKEDMGALDSIWIKLSQIQVNRKK